MELSKTIELIRIRHSLRTRQCRFDGGKGSGNWGHKGRPGQIGGSQEGGGTHNRRVQNKGNGNEYTSFSKRRKESYQIHGLKVNEIISASRSSDVILVDDKGNHFTVHNSISKSFICRETGEIKQFHQGEPMRVILPKRFGANYQITKEDKKAMKANTEAFKKAEVIESGPDADKAYRKKTGDIWEGCSKEQKDDLYLYTTSDHRKINDSLRRGEVYDYYTERAVENITDAIDKSVIEKDSVFFRGVSKAAAEKMFGLPKGYLSGQMKDNMPMVGRVGTDNGFVSCGAARGTGFEDEVRLEIYAPAGTKGLYCEPFAGHGNGAGVDWNGKDPQKSISHECEILLQRGCTMQVIGHDVTDGNTGITTHVLKVAIIRQKPGDYKYEGG